VTNGNEKAERLAAALRENLKRRKAQARGLKGEGQSDQEEAALNIPAPEAPR
jgi:hypothetical protein